jgi:hypothetical protein
VKSSPKDKDRINSRNPCFKEVDSIANGVLQKYASIFNLHGVIIEETAAIAQELGISNKNIESWEDERNKKLTKLRIYSE